MLCFGKKKSLNRRYDVITLLSPEPLKNLTPVIFIIRRFQGINKNKKIASNNRNLMKSLFVT